MSDRLQPCPECSHGAKTVYHASGNCAKKSAMTVGNYNREAIRDVDRMIAWERRVTGESPHD